MRCECIAGRAPQDNGDGLVRATRSPFGFRSHTRLRLLAAHFARALAGRVTPKMKEGAGKTGCRPGTRGPLCERWQQELAQRHTGEAKHPAFPAQWSYGLCRALPGERCTIAPVALRMADVRARSGRRITATLDASLRAPGPHDFAVRGSHRSFARCLRSRLPALRNHSRRCDLRPPQPGPRS